MSLNLQSLDILDIKINSRKMYCHARGFFSETHIEKTSAKAGAAFDPVRDNRSMSPQVGALLDFHYQPHPLPQNRLERVVRGRILDVAID